MISMLSDLLRRDIDLRRALRRKKRAITRAPAITKGNEYSEPRASSFARARQSPKTFVKRLLLCL